MKKPKQAKAAEGSDSDKSDTAIARARKIRIHWHPKFLEALRLDMRVYNACVDAGVSRDTVYRHKKIFPEFNAEFDEIIENSTDDLEHALMDRAINGVDTPIMDKEGKRIGTKTEYSDQVGIFLLRGRRRHVYGDRVDVTTKPEFMSDEDARARGKVFMKGMLETIMASIGEKVRA